MVPKCFLADISARANDPERFKTAGYAVFQANLVLNQIVAKCEKHPVGLAEHGDAS